MREAQQSATTAAAASMAAVGAGTVVLKAFPSPRFLFFVGAYLFVAQWLAVTPALAAELVPPILGWVITVIVPVALLLLWFLLLALLIGEDEGVAQGARILSIAVLIVASMLIPLPVLRAMGGKQAQMVMSYFVAWLVLAWIFSGVATLVGARARRLLTGIVYLACLPLIVVPIWVFIATRVEVGRHDQPIRDQRDLWRVELPTLERVSLLVRDRACHVERLLDSGVSEERCAEVAKLLKEPGKPPAR